MAPGVDGIAPWIASLPMYVVATMVAIEFGTIVIDAPNVLWAFTSGSSFQPFTRLA